MTGITVSHIDDTLTEWLRARAAGHGRSIAAEAHDILRQALRHEESARIATTPMPGNLGEAIRAIVEPIGGIELDIPPREPIREPPKFE
ncbi:MAG: FitA-like ribbon-helix-helix domain-containing protein [Hyphomicrobiaceae bacterium]